MNPSVNETVLQELLDDSYAAFERMMYMYELSLHITTNDPTFNPNDFDLQSFIGQNIDDHEANMTDKEKGIREHFKILIKQREKTIQTIEKREEKRVAKSDPRRGLHIVK